MIVPPLGRLVKVCFKGGIFYGETSEYSCLDGETKPLADQSPERWGAKDLLLLQAQPDWTAGSQCQGGRLGLDDGIQGGNLRVEELFDAYVDDLKKTTSQSNWRKIEWYGRVWLKPQIGAKRDFPNNRG